MPARSQARIRREINRMAELIEREGSNPALGAIAPIVKDTAAQLNAAWQNYQQAAVSADKERSERDSAVAQIRTWIQRWRPILLLTTPGAESNTRGLPPSGSTPDDTLRVARDLMTFMEETPSTASFREAAREDLGSKLEAAQRETHEATQSLPNEEGARAALTEASVNANRVLVRGIEVVRAIFGPASANYRQFMSRETGAEAEEEDALTEAGEQPEAA